MRNSRKAIICGLAFLVCVGYSLLAQHWAKAQQPTPGVQIITAPTGVEVLDDISNTVSSGITMSTVQKFSTEGIGTPTIASGACGTGSNGTLATGSTNRTGEVLVGSAATATCTIAWSAGSPFTTAAPLSCTLSPGNAAGAASSAYVSAITTAHFVISGSLTSADLYYHCF
jgi:hypothetical protein